MAKVTLFEAPRSKLRGSFDRKEVCYFQIRSLTPQSRFCSGTGNALAFAVQMRNREKGQVQEFAVLLPACAGTADRAVRELGDVAH